MQLQIESTEDVGLIDGVPVRVWNGTTPSGAECVVFVRAIAAAEATDPSEFGDLLTLPQADIQTRNINPSEN